MLTSQVNDPLAPEHPSRWRWPIDVARYDRTPELIEAEREALTFFTRTYQDRAVIVARAEQQGQLARLIEPLRDALAVMESEERLKINTLHLYLRMCARDGRPFWAWEYEIWLKALSTSQADFFTMHKPGNPTDLRQLTVAVAYLLGCFRDFQALGGMEMARLASKVLGSARSKPPVRQSWQSMSSGATVARIFLPFAVSLPKHSYSMGALLPQI